MEDCLFCKFVSGEIPVTKVFEDELMIIIRDIEPKAKNHFLLILKKHFKYLAEMTEEDGENLAKCLRKLNDLTDVLELKDGFRLVINQGDDAGQSVPHLHVHILSGQKMEWTPA
ncbi:MAG: HIT domain-containing protein [Clostridia bacterium]